MAEIESQHDEIDPSPEAKVESPEILPQQIEIAPEIETAREQNDSVAPEDSHAEISPEVQNGGDEQVGSDTVADAGSTERDGNVEAAVSNGDVGSREFTMRKLLDELKENKGLSGSSTDVAAASSDGAAAMHASSNGGSPYSQDTVQQRYIGQSDTSMELINNVTGMDEEGRSRQRILAFAAKRYASAIEKNPADHDAYYNWALVLQVLETISCESNSENIASNIIKHRSILEGLKLLDESADNVSHDSSSPSKDALLEEACKKYDEATRLCPTLHDAYYNWAIAISDRAKMRGRTKEAEELWKQATKNYEKAVQLNWNSPQALNNWGLALQELSAIVPVREKQTIVKTAISKFRAAIQLQFDFHRAIYNLGTVLYGLAEDTLRSARPVSAKEVSPDELYSQSAIYIAAAHSLKPNYSVYRSALRLVRSMLPLPYLKVGYLTAPPTGDPIAPHSDWERSQFILNHEGLQQVSKGAKKLTESPSGRLRGSGSINKSLVKVDVPDIVSVSACADLTLPPGAGLCIDTVQGPVFLVADTWDSLDGWLDAIRLVYTIYAREKSDVLAGVITG